MKRVMLKIKKILAVAWVCAIITPFAVTAEASKDYIFFLDKKQAAIAIVDDALEPYFNKLQPMEMSAKTGGPLTATTLEKQRIQCRERYQDAVLNFSGAEQTAIKWYIDKLRPVLLKDYPLVGAIPWSFIKVSDAIEGGLPHTRGKYIVMSETMCNQMVMQQQMPSEDLAYLPVLELLAHEQIHVFQRAYPKQCDSLYTKVWGFEKANSIKGCNWLDKYHLANPDAVDCRWVLPVKNGQATSYLWPVVVFSEGEGLKKMPNDFRMIAVSVTKSNNNFSVQVSADGAPVSKDLQRVKEFRTLFPLTTYVFHPNEVAADMFGKLIVIDNFIPADVFPPEAKEKLNQHLSLFRTWFKDNCKSGPQSPVTKTKKLS
jgi:hypothetical protein